MIGKDSVVSEAKDIAREVINSADEGDVPYLSGKVHGFASCFVGVDANEFMIGVASGKFGEEDLDYATEHELQDDLVRWVVRRESLKEGGVEDDEQEEYEYVKGVVDGLSFVLDINPNKIVKNFNSGNRPLKGIREEMN